MDINSVKLQTEITINILKEKNKSLLQDKQLIEQFNDRLIKYGFEKLIKKTAKSRSDINDDNDNCNALNTLILYGCNDFMKDNQILFNNNYSHYTNKIRNDNYSKLFLRGINIDLKRGLFIDSTSYIILFKRIILSKFYFEFFNVDYKKIINDSQNKLLLSIDKFFKKANISLEKTTKLVDMLNQIYNAIKIEDKEKLIENIDEFNKYIKDNKINDNILYIIQNKLIALKQEILEKNKPKQEKKKEENIPVKMGTREDRIKAHQKNKLLEKLEETKGRLTSDSKIWVELILDQINKDTDSFIENPSEYLPGFKEDQANLIKDVVLMELEYQDKDESIINVVKNY